MSTGESTTPDIDNMKVPELKKRLKSMGLSTNGNKAELIERLQDAYLGEKDGSLDGGLDDESLEEALLNDDPDHSAMSETAIGTEELSFSSPEKESQKEPANVVAKPLKKRAVAPATETPKPTKPIVLKRDNYPTIEAPKPVAKKDHPLIEPPKADDATKTEKTTATERLQMRAKRFNIIDAKKNTDSSKAPDAVKVDVAAGKISAGTKPPILPPSSVKSEDLDVLRKRAQRFGENVSTVMKQLENQEKLLKRKQKFSGSTTQEVNTNGKVLNLNEQERKKKRMERFGL